MSLSSNDMIHIVLALAALLGASHGVGYVFKRFRQPQVIGEILGGLLLGPTVLKALLPAAHAFLFTGNQPTQVVLGTIYNLGLLLLMFCSGMEMRSSFGGGERRTAAFVSFAGSVVPFALAFPLLGFVDMEAQLGEARHLTAFTLIFATGTAVTSIPVISRIMFDLGVLNTSFARIVLSSAVVEDVILYIVISIALGMVGAHGSSHFGLPALLGLAPGSSEAFLYHVVSTLAFFGLMLLLGPGLFRRLVNFKFNFLRKRDSTGFLLAFVFVLTAGAIALGIAPMLGAFLAGILVHGDDPDTEYSRETLKAFAFAFFIPIYFAIVGLRLDLLRAFNPTFFVLFLLAACVIKIGSTYLGARIAGERHRAAFNLGIAMNARGGPGIVLASLAFDAAIINESFYVSLILLSVMTSLLAGSWLGYLVGRGEPLR